MRLTKKVEDKAAFHVCDKTCLTCNGTSCGFTQAIVDRLAAYEEAEEQGRLVILPCKVGDVVYRIHTKDHVVKNRIIAFHVSASGIWYWDETGRETPIEKIGKTVFLSRAEAEAEAAQKGESKDV